MFIFIFFTQISCHLLNSLFTFHYVYIYIRAGSCCCNSCIIIYIPLCLYLYAIWCSACDVGTSIYIPLCLYLYAIELQTICILLNLHSTMFIFIFLAFRLMLDCGLIYIPLCLYLYFIIVKYQIFYCCIYIPLCLYLYHYVCM